MQHHCLHPPGHDAVAHGQIDRERLMRAAQIGRAIGFISILSGKGFPDGAPFGAR